MKKIFSKHRDFTLLCFLLCIAFLLRIYKITEQSIWHEESLYVTNILLCDLWTNIKLLFINVPEYGISPGGLILYYFFIHLFPDTIWLWRLLPITFGLFSIVLIYYMGKWLKDWRIGFFAGILIAISPFNIFIHQELKNYSFLLFLSLLSWVALFKYSTDNKKGKWFCLGILTNLLLPWFHALYFLVPISQFPLLIWLKSKEKFRDTAIWIIGNCIFLLPYVLWVMWINPPAYNLTITEKEKINLNFIITSLFGNDCVGVSNELLPYWKTNTVEIVSSPFWIALLNGWKLFDYSLLLTIILCFSFFAFYSLRNIQYKNINIQTEAQKKIVLLYSFLFPSLFFLFLGLITKKTFFLPLYFYPAFSFLYLIVAYIVIELKNGWVRRILISLIILLFSFQCFGFIPFNNRSDYKRAVEYLDKNVKKGEVVLDLQLGSNVFEPWKIYKKRKDYELIPIFSLQEVSNRCVENFFNPGNSSGNSLWVLMETSLITWIYQTDPTYIIVKYLTPLGLKVDIKHFPGKFNMYVLKIERDPYYEQKKEVEVEIPPFCNIDYEKLIKLFDLKTSTEEERAKMNYKLKKYFSIFPPFYSYNYILILNSMIQNGDLELAGKICDYILRNSPEFYHVHFLKGLILLTTDDKDGAKQELSSVFSENYIFESMYKNLWLNYLSNRTNDKDLMLFQVLEEKGYHILNKSILNAFFRNNYEHVILK